MTYADALAWWYQRIDFEKKPATPVALKLERMHELLHRLGDPQDELLVVHIAGSKGKGSTAALFESIARAAGHRTGLFTSPHLTDVRERIQVDAQPISVEELTAQLSEVRPAADAMARTGEAPTFFEIATAIGFLHFVRSKVDVAVIEVGLGGRLDSTNVLDRPAVTVITSISYDHVAILGTELAQIAAEKGGIIKPGVPVVSGVTAPEAAAVVRQIAAERGSPLRELGTDFSIEPIAGRVNDDGRLVMPARLIYRVGNVATEYELGLLGQHQAANASLAVTAVTEIAQRLPITQQAISEGLRTVRWPARMEVFAGRPPVVLDCAHNVASAQALVDTLSESFPAGPRAMVFASSLDKDVPEILATLAPAFQHIILTCFGDNPRATPTDRLLEILNGLGHRAIAFDDPLASLNAARQLPVSLVTVTGSVFLAGAVRPNLLCRQDSTDEHGFDG